jgi:NAD(P)-dependent dehydrogenase (short-subunit alcohol dehydrogenase family)
MLLVMSLINSFNSPANAVICGASGGIGNALVRALAEDERAGSVVALSRTPPAADSPKVTSLPLDILDEASVASIAARCAEAGPIDLVIVATGILHDGKRLRPEKRMQDLDAEAMAEVFRVNSIAPAILAKHFLPLMRRDGKSAFAAISARVGSIGDNRLGGWASYRASKAALNMLIKTLSIEHARTHQDGIVAALHPGTTDTALSKPFQRNVPEGKLFSPEFTAERLLRVLDELSGDDTGGFFAWNGDPIEF